jgi:hypothetical protein
MVGCGSLNNFSCERIASTLSSRGAAPPAESAGNAAWDRGLGELSAGPRIAGGEVRAGEGVGSVPLEAEKLLSRHCNKC